jgi:hypothetical protein
VPGLGVDLDYGDVGPVGEGHVFGIEEMAFIEARRHAERQVVPEMRLARHFAECHDPAFAIEAGEVHAGPPPEDDMDHLVCDLLADVRGGRYDP